MRCTSGIAHVNIFGYSTIRSTLLIVSGVRALLTKSYALQSHAHAYMRSNTWNIARTETLHGIDVQSTELSCSCFCSWCCSCCRCDSSGCCCNCSYKKAPNLLPTAYYNKARMFRYVQKEHQPHLQGVHWRPLGLLLTRHTCTLGQMPPLCCA